MSGEGSDPQAVLTDLCDAITPASRAQEIGADKRLARPPGEGATLLERLAIWLAGTRHTPRPVTAKKRILVAAADHGVGDPGVDLGDASPTLVSLRQLESGRAALSAAARGAGAHIALIDAGVWGDSSPIPGLIELRQGAGTADITKGPAMRPEDAAQAITSGLALVFSFAEEELDLLALGALGTGSDVASTAVIASLSRAPPATLGGPDAEAARDALAQNAPDAERPIEVVAAVGGFEVAVLAGAILGAAAISVPIVLDAHTTAAAALVATRLAPNVGDYLLASHTGGSPIQKRALDALSLKIEPLLSVGVSRGEGSGAALALPVLDAAAALLSTPQSQKT